MNAGCTEDAAEMATWIASRSACWKRSALRDMPSERQSERRRALPDSAAAALFALALALLPRRKEPFFSPTAAASTLVERRKTTDSKQLPVGACAACAGAHVRHTCSRAKGGGRDAAAAGRVPVERVDLPVRGGRVGDGGLGARSVTVRAQYAAGIPARSTMGRWREPRQSSVSSNLTATKTVRPALPRSSNYGGKNHQPNIITMPLATLAPQRL